jgi:hypothetical protein
VFPPVTSESQHSITHPPALLPPDHPPPAAPGENALVALTQSSPHQDCGPILDATVALDGQVHDAGCAALQPSSHQHLAAAAGTLDEAFRIEVERFEEIDENYVWTLSLKGFQKGHWIYIYRKGERSYLRGTSGHAIADPTARTQVRAKASLFVVSKREEYEFRYVRKARACALQQTLHAARAFLQ